MRKACKKKRVGRKRKSRIFVRRNHIEKSVLVEAYKKKVYEESA